jgi:hypothetical protein
MDSLKKTYAALSDSELLRIANHEAIDLTPQALAILKQELKRRNLMDDQQLPLVGVQPQEAFDPDLEDLVVRFQNSFCPICGNNRGINLYESRLALGFTHKRSILGCRSCLIKQIEGDSTFSGWTSLLDVFGLPATVFTFSKVRVLKSRVLEEIKMNISNTPTGLLRRFVKDNRQMVREMLENGDESEWPFPSGGDG